MKIITKIFNLFLLILINLNLFSANIKHIPKIIKADPKILKPCAKMATEFYKLLEHNKFLHEFFLYLNEKETNQQNQIKFKLIEKYSKILMKNIIFKANFGENDIQAAEFIIRNLFELQYGNYDKKLKFSLRLNIYLSLIKIETADFNSF